MRSVTCTYTRVSELTSTEEANTEEESEPAATPSDPSDGEEATSPDGEEATTLDGEEATTPPVEEKIVDNRVVLIATGFDQEISSFFQLRIPGFSSPRSTSPTSSFEFTSFDGEGNVLDT